MTNQELNESGDMQKKATESARSNDTSERLKMIAEKVIGNIADSFECKIESGKLLTEAVPLFEEFDDYRAWARKHLHMGPTTECKLRRT